MRGFRAAMSAAGLLFAAAQLVSIRLTNPVVSGELTAPSEVTAVLRRACYDCHSNATIWPWYTRLAPASWLACRHVSEARARLNFSNWSDYALDPGTESHKLEEIAEQIRSGAMPPWYYRLMHREARLTPSERSTLLDWVGRERAAADAKVR
jgi:cytochrome c551/c552